MPLSFRKSVLAIIFTLITFSCREALARPEYERRIREIVRPAPGSAIASAQCGICHKGAPPTLNGFGSAVQRSLRAAATAELSDSVLARVSMEDSDGDSVTNQREMEAGTLPGDASSRPGKPSQAAIGGLFPAHSFHPLVVHFPVALLLFGAILEVCGARMRRPEYRTAGFLNISAAAVFSAFAIVTGVAALVRQGMPLSGVPLFHLCMGSTASVAMILLASRGVVENRRGLGRSTPLYWALLGAAFLAVAGAGHLGSMLVFG